MNTCMEGVIIQITVMFCMELPYPWVKLMAVIGQFYGDRNLLPK